MSRRVLFLMLLAVSILSLRAIQFYDICVKDYVQEVDRSKNWLLAAVVGMLCDVVYQKDVVQLTPGDILMIYSDGLTEAMNAEEVEFGEDRAIRSIYENRHLSVETLKDWILDEVNAFVGDVPQHDDLTLVIARVL